MLKLLHENTSRLINCYHTVNAWFQSSDDVASQSLLSPARTIEETVDLLGVEGGYEIAEVDFKEVLYLLSFSCAQVSNACVACIQFLKLRRTRH